jgi:dTDP-4-dehydrorhamnose reductase
VNRIGDSYVEQLERTGVAGRLEDMDRLASLGAERVRFPLLWERTETSPGEYDFGWAEERLHRLRALGVRPIAGLLHHGSGPVHTSLLDPELPTKLADYALAVARRFPWIDAWTPVNEPVTTARFCGLYGLWYPHGRHDAHFVRILLQQLKATVSAMRAVRRVVPGALLIQTEDLGHTTGTAPLQYQAEFDNQRRWLSFDLLAGHVDSNHPLWHYLLQNGATQKELAAFTHEPLLPDVLGINSYVTSERFLDHRIERYPASSIGGNGRHRYADVEAVRMQHHRVGGFEARLEEAAERYGQPLAVTEAHIGCTREEQLRWLFEAWQAAQRLRARGVDVRAVTAWSAFGAYDWGSLLVERADAYESGLWDARGPAPRPTALVKLARELAAGRPPEHPVLAQPGWWRRDVRVLHGAPATGPEALTSGDPPGNRSLLIIGGQTALGQAFARLCTLRGLVHQALRGAEAACTVNSSIDALLQTGRPWAVVNAGGLVQVEDARREPAQWAQNASAAIALGEACERSGIPLLTFSSHRVFGGSPRWPWLEEDNVSPLCVQGCAAARTDQALHPLASVLTVRTSALFGPWDRGDFLTRGLDRLARGERWVVPADEMFSPTYVPDLVHACLDLLIDGEQGLWHVANRGETSVYDFACRAAQAAHLPSRLVSPCRAEQSAKGIAYGVLGTSRGQLLGHLDAAIAQYAQAVNFKLTEHSDRHALCKSPAGELRPQ